MTRSTTVLHKLAVLLLPPGIWLGVWQAGAWLVDQGVGGRGNELLLPYPATAISALIALGSEGMFWQSILASLGRILLGLCVGVALGLVLAGISCAWRWGDRLLSPAIRVVRATPVASFIILVLLWAPRGLIPTVISALMVLPVVWETVVRGLREADPALLELALAYRFSPLKKGKLIYLPSLRPYLTSAIVTAAGLAWKSGIAAEVLCQPPFAIGGHIYATRLYLEIPELFAWTAVVAALSLALEGLLRRLLLRWGRRWRQ